MSHKSSLKHDGLLDSSSTTVHPYARILGPGVAASGEFVAFYSTDTMAKRLMSYQGHIIDPKNPALTRERVANIIFRDAAKKAWYHKILSLYPGMSYGIAYKISQRIYKFGGQPMIKDILCRSYLAPLSSSIGEKRSRIFLEAIAGACVGIGEVVLLPIDVLKIKSQTNPEVLKGRTVWDLLRRENYRLFAGAGWTVARNVPGSLGLFGGNAMVKEFVFNLDGGHATLSQTLASSATGSVCSLVLSSPFDVIKTRVQNQPFDKPISGFQVVRDILKNEGMVAFARGIVPKLVTVGPKLVTSFTAAQYLTSIFSQSLNSNAKAL